MNHVALTAEVVEDCEWQHILNPVLTVVVHSTLELENSFEVNGQIDIHIVKGACLVDIELD